MNGNNLNCCLLHLLMASYLLPPLGLHSAHRLDTTAWPAHRSSLSLSEGFVPVCSFFYPSHPNLLLLLPLLILLLYYYSSTSITLKALIFSSLIILKSIGKILKKSSYISVFVIFLIVCKLVSLWLTFCWLVLVVGDDASEDGLRTGCESLTVLLYRFMLLQVMAFVSK